MARRSRHHIIPTQTTSGFLRSQYSLQTAQVRGLGKGKVVDGKEVMLACDSVRDKVLPELGVRLEDRSDGERKLVQEV